MARERSAARLAAPAAVASRVRAAVRPVPAERVAVAVAGGRVLAATVRARDDLPRFAASAMDGWAMRWADARAGAVLRVAGRVLAGSPAGARVRPGTAVFVATGGRIPPGADAVVPIEDAVRRGGDVAVGRGSVRGRHVRRAGEDVRAGAVVRRAGTVLGPRDLALLAGIGCTLVAVRRRPRVAILPTGDEVGGTGAGAIHDSASPALAAMVTACGGTPVVRPPVADRRAAVEAALRTAARTADAVVTIGGVSVGPRDFAGDSLRRVGRVRVAGVRLKPGKPFTFGLIGRTPVFALPGNPGSAIVTFHLFVAPALRRMAGRPPAGPGVAARLAAPQPAHRSRLMCVWGTASHDGHGWTVRSAGPAGSHRLLPAARANALVHLPPRMADYRRGERVRVDLLGAPA